MKKYYEWPGAAAAILLILAVFSWPYSFYVLLRWIVAGVSIYVVSYLINLKDNKYWIFIAIAIIFNPITPIYANRSIWTIVDLLAAGLFLAYSKKQIVNKKSVHENKHIIDYEELKSWDEIKRGGK